MDTLEDEIASGDRTTIRIEPDGALTLAGGVVHVEWAAANERVACEGGGSCEGKGSESGASLESRCEQISKIITKEEEKE